MLDEAQQRQRAEAQLQRRIRQERAEYERRERERVLREANRLKSIARLRLVLARRAIKHFEDKSKDLSQYSRWEKRKKSLEKAVLTRTRVLQTAQQNLDTKDVRSRAERRELQANVTEQELKLENTRAALQSVEANLQRHTKPVLTYVDAALYYRGKAYLALAAAMADETQAATAENTGRVRGWLGLLLSRAQDMEQRGMTQWSDEKGAFFDQVVDTQTSPQRMVSQQDFARALAQLITMPSAKARWMDGGGYARAEDVVVPNGGSAMVVRGATHTYGTGFGELSRGLWMIDPLVPMPGMETAAGGNQVQWPPQPQGEVPTPDGVSLWMWSRDRERWEPGGLQEERRLRQRSEP